MKHKKLLLYFLIGVSSIFAISCSYDEFMYEYEYTTPIPDALRDSTIGPADDYGSMHCVIGGSSWDSDTVWAIVSNNELYITGRNNTSNTEVKLKMSGSSSQTFLLGTANNWATYSESAVTYTDFNGSIVLSQVNTTEKLLQGTFQFEASEPGGNTRSIVSGTFEDVTYFGEIYNNIWVADVDGSTWHPDVVNAVLDYNQIVVTASNSSGNLSLEIYIPETANSADPPFEFDSLSVPKAKYILSGTEYLSKSGFITIADHNFANNTMEATFYFQAGELGNSQIEHTITNGSFSVTYTE